MRLSEGPFVRGKTSGRFRFFHISHQKVENNANSEEKEKDINTAVFLYLNYKYVLVTTVIHLIHVATEPELSWGAFWFNDPPLFAPSDSFPLSAHIIGAFSMNFRGLLQCMVLGAQVGIPKGFRLGSHQQKCFKLGGGKSLSDTFYVFLINVHNELSRNVFLPHCKNVHGLPSTTTIRQPYNIIKCIIHDDDDDHNNNNNNNPHPHQSQLRK